jgi:E3 ubiquitin-protein ligase RNF181
MSDYFQEMNFEHVEDDQIEAHQLMLMVRYLRQSGYDELLNMQEFNSERLPPPASKNLVANLKSRLVTEHDEKCPICLAPNENLDGEKFLTLPCSHEFHDGCILPWLDRTNSCPLCRAEMKTDDQAYEEQKRKKQRKQENIEALHNSMFG